MKRIAGSLKQMIGCLSIVCIFALLAGCSKPENKILGKWESKQEYTKTWEFYKDGTFILTQEGDKRPTIGRYAFIDANQIKMESGDSGRVEDTYVVAVSFSKEFLILTFKGKESFPEKCTKVIGEDRQAKDEAKKKLPETARPQVRDNKRGTSAENYTNTISQLENKILGKWQSADSKESYMEFYKDGSVNTVSLRSDGKSYRGIDMYKFIDENHIQLSRVSGGTETLVDTLEVVFSDGFIIFTGWEKKPFKYTKVLDEGQQLGDHAEVLTNSIGMKFKLIPAGSFKRDSSNVKITKPFYLGIYEVTQEQYEKVMGLNPSKNAGPKNPVETVSWDDAKAFCKKLSGIEKQEYRLPTEAEWEYACRAGTTTAFYWGDTFDEKFAWIKTNSGRKSQEIGTRQANPWGLYDMSGNVWEWCEDWYAEYPTGEQVDPKGAASGSDRVSRGGNWDGVPQFCRSAFRNGYAPDFRFNSLGFRVLAVPAAGK